MVRSESGEEHYRKALKLTSDSSAKAASFKPGDAMETLDVEAARRERE
jgi:hypothetical protein